MHPYEIAALVYFGACYTLGFVRLLISQDESLGQRVLAWVFSPVSLPWCILEPLLELAGDIADLGDD